MVGFLEKARPFADAPQQEILGHLIDYFATATRGVPRLQHRLGQARDSGGRDPGLHRDVQGPRGQKGRSRGSSTSSTAAPRACRRTRSLAQYFEDRPLGRGLQAQRVQRPDRNAVNVLHAAGDSVPCRRSA